MFQIILTIDLEWIAEYSDALVHCCLIPALSFAALVVLSLMERK